MIKKIKFRIYNKIAYKWENYIILVNKKTKLYSISRKQLLEKNFKN